MIKLLLPLFILIFLSLNSKAQSNEIKIAIGSELPTRSWFKTDLDNFNKFEHEKLRTLAGLSLNANYSRLLSSKLGLYANVQFGLSQQRYYQPILEQNGTQVAELNLSLNRMDVFLGAFKRFKIYEGKISLDLGINVGKRFYLNDGEILSQTSEAPTINDWITHTYELQTFQSEFFENDINLLRRYRGFVEFEIISALNFQINEMLSLNLNTIISPNHFTFYDYNYTLFYYQNGSSTPTGVYNFSGIANDRKFVVKDLYLRSSIGLTYKF